MKKLYLVRHAKSSWKYPKLDDFERPLNKRGRKNASLMGDVLKARSIMPDLILSSPANRAATTARIIAPRVNYPLDDIFYTESLYGAGQREMIAMIQQMDDEIMELMIVGHNPGITDLVNAVGNDLIHNIPTSGICGVDFKISSWKRILSLGGKTRFFEYPKKYV